MTDNTNTQTPEASSVPSLTLSDLVAARNIAKIAIDGKFFKRGDESQAIEAVYNKFNDFIVYANEANKKAEEEENKKAE